MQKIEKILRISRSEKANYRLKIIEFHRKYGIRITRDAFGVSKATIYRWRSKYLKSKKSEISLIPKSTKPINVNQMRVDSRIIDFLRVQREIHYRLGKEKIKPLLDEYCKSIHLNTISEASIGRVIKKYKLFSTKKGRIYHNPSLEYGKRKISYKIELQKNITWYNTKRIHRGLKNITPMQFINNLYLQSHMS